MTQIARQDSQSHIAAFLASSPDLFGPDVAVVDRVETHISRVFLGGDTVFKLKRAVKYPYLDFSTPDLRREACEAEVAINRRTAPAVYRGVRAVMRGQDGQLFLAGPEDRGGEVLDWVVEMARFDDATLFDKLAEKGALDRRLIEALATEIADFHGRVDVITCDDGYARLANTVTGIADSFAAFGPGVVDMDKVETLMTALQGAAQAHADLLNARGRAGQVRHCHGDLHLRNIFLDASGAPVLFDAIEFNRLFVDIDVLYDVAFLWMDLDYRGLRRLASFAMNRYLDITGDGEGLVLFPLMMGMRAAIRAHVCASAAVAHSDLDAGERLKGEAHDYLALALSYLGRQTPRLLATGGLSGSGKSRLARELAPLMGGLPGARVVRSDAIRKRLAGVPLLTRLGPDGYTPDMNARTYETLYEEVRSALASGYPVIADAVFARADERARIEDLARDAGVPFTGLWLEADPAIMAERAENRVANVSDAGADVVKRQLGYDLGPISWVRIDSSGARAETLARGRGAAGV